MSIDRWMDKEVVVHTHNRISLSHKKECIGISSNEVDEPGACYSEWSKSERERQISYTKTYMESRKMVLKNLFAGQQWRNIHRKQTYGHGEREGEGVEKRNCSCTVGGNVDWYNHYGRCYRNSFKKIRINPPYDPAMPLLGIYPEETKIEKDMYPSFHCSSYNS